MDGQVALVTGATSGIGRAAAIAIAGLGAEVHLVGRDAARGQDALTALEQVAPGRGHLHLVDLSDPAAVAELGEQVIERSERLNVLVHNAGALLRSYGTTPAGIERTVATQVLGPYALTATLLPLLIAASPATIVTVSSGGMYTQRFDLSELEMGEQGYDGVIAYARAKRAQLVLADAWSERFSPAGVASFAMHPGWVDTPGLAEGLPRFRSIWKPALRSVADGADTIVWLAAGGPAAAAATEGRPAPVSGFFHDRHPRATQRRPVTRPTTLEDGEALLAWCAKYTGIETPVLEPRA